jgi:2-C-methyl-D-erythritol 4-phosphate cytidylyltransferase
LLESRTRSKVEKRVIAIVPAAGLGKRFGSNKNKLFSLLAGKPVLIWSLELLQSVPEITEIIPVVKEEDLMMSAALTEDYGIRKVKQIVPGGKERQDSVYCGLSTISDDKAIVLIHDGGRPFADSDIIADAIRQVEGCDGVVAGVPVKDTIKEVAEETRGAEVANVFVGRTLDRSVLYAIQTPQVFPFRVIMQAHEKARDDRFIGTDDASLVERYGGRVKIVAGSYRNIKITTSEDIFVAEALLRMRESRLS